MVEVSGRRIVYASESCREEEHCLQTKTFSLDDMVVGVILWEAFSWASLSPLAVAENTRESVIHLRLISDKLQLYMASVFSDENKFFNWVKLCTRDLELSNSDLRSIMMNNS